MGELFENFDRISPDRTTVYEKRRISKGQASVNSRTDNGMYQMTFSMDDSRKFEEKGFLYACLLVSKLTGEPYLIVSDNGDYQIARTSNNDVSNLCVRNKVMVRAVKSALRIPEAQKREIIAIGDDLSIDEARMVFRLSKI